MNKLGDTIKVKTEHFTFEVYVKNNYARDVYYSQYLEVGESTKPCLSLTIFTEDAEQFFGPDTIKTAKLSNIEALYNCVIEDDDSKNYFSKYSFGKELLLWVIKYIKSNFTHVKYLELDDESYIPCNRENIQTLDLLSYSIAVNCKTWYELHFNAYLPSKSNFDNYKMKVKTFCSSEFKSKISWELFFLKYVTSRYANDIIKADEKTYENMYNNAKTFPEFFRTLSDFIGKEKRCIFFKHWLQSFVKNFVNVEKRWIIPLRPSGGGKKSRRINRKRTKTISNS